MRRVAAVAAVLLLAGACGNRLSHQDVISAAGSSRVALTTDTGGDKSDPSSASGASAGVVDPGAANATQLATGGAAGVSSAGRSGAAAAGAASAAGGSTASSRTDSGVRAPIVIGSVGNLSGPAGAAEAPGAQAAQVWARMVNDRGGVNGHHVTLTLVDDGSDPARHGAEVKDLVENKRVIAFVAQMASSTHQGAAKYLAAKHVPVVGGDGTIKLWNENPMYFPTSLSPDNLFFGALQTASRFAKGHKLGTLTCVEAQVCTDAKAGYARYAAPNGFTLAYQGTGSLAQPDFTAECLSARNAGVEVMVPVFDLNSVKRLGASCSRQGFKPLWVLGFGVSDKTFETISTYEGSPAAMPSFPFVGLDSPAAREYADAYRRYSPGTLLSPIGAQGWAGAKLFEKAAQNVGNEPTSEQILEGLYALHGDTLGGLTAPLTYVRDKPAPAGKCWFAMRIVGGKWGPVDGDRSTCRP